MQDRNLCKGDWRVEEASLVSQKCLWAQDLLVSLGLGLSFLTHPTLTAARLHYVQSVEGNLVHIFWKGSFYKLFLIGREGRWKIQEATKVSGLK